MPNLLMFPSSSFCDILRTDYKRTNIFIYKQKYFIQLYPVNQNEILETCAKINFIYQNPSLSPR